MCVCTCACMHSHNWFTTHTHTHTYIAWVWQPLDIQLNLAVSLYTKCTEAPAWKVLVCSGTYVYFSACALSYFAHMCPLLTVFINFWVCTHFSCCPRSLLYIYLSLQHVWNCLLSYLSIFALNDQEKTVFYWKQYHNILSLFLGQ
jgi:hypothetical protein